MSDIHDNSALGSRASLRQSSAWLRWLLITAAVGIIGLLVVLPVVAVFVEAFSDGFGAYWESLTADPQTRSAIRMTLLVTPAAVVMNTIFGVAAAWAIARFRFPGRALFTTLIDLPFSISPVVVGLMLVLLYGRQGYLGPWLAEHGIKILFDWPALILATSFVTLPFVARELIPVMEAIGADEEVAAVSLGANSWQLFWQVTLPNIKWGLLYGVILCSARAMGEFGAVYVVSGHVSGPNMTLPLRIDELFNDAQAPHSASFAVASLLTSLALVSLAAKVALQRKTRRQLAEAARTGSEADDETQPSASPARTETAVAGGDAALNDDDALDEGAGL